MNDWRCSTVDQPDMDLATDGCGAVPDLHHGRAGARVGQPLVQPARSHATEAVVVGGRPPEGQARRCGQERMDEVALSVELDGRRGRQGLCWARQHLRAPDRRR